MAVSFTQEIEIMDCLLSDVLGARLKVDGKPCIVSSPGEVGHLIYGPYERYPAGRYRVEVQIALADVPETRIGDFVCATIDITFNRASSIAAVRHIRRSELTSDFQTFELHFVLQGDRNLECRVHSNGQAGLVVSAGAVVTRLPDATVRASPAGSREREWDNDAESLDGYLRNITGVVHVGANTGQERFMYRIIGLDVLWVEAIPHVYEELLNHIAGFSRQRAVRALLTDREGETYRFNISNLGAGSSSILPFDQHAEIMPEIKYVEVQELVSTTFQNMVHREGVDLGEYQALTLDAEGAEVLIIKGAGELISKFRYIKCEVSDFPSRTGAPTSDELDALLQPLGFRQLVRKAFAYGPNGNGVYWDIVWKREADGPLHRPGVSLPIISDHTWDRIVG